MNASRRADGYAPVGDYAALSDGRSVALVASDGQIDWWPVPVLDAPPVCAALLDAECGGYFSLAPQDPFSASHRYLPGTNVVQTTFTTGTGSVLVTDALNVGTAAGCRGPNWPAGSTASTGTSPCAGSSVPVTGSGKPARGSPEPGSAPGRRRRPEHRPHRRRRRGLAHLR